MLKGYPLDLVGISTYTLTSRCSKNNQHRTRGSPKDAVIVLGGPHCAMFPEYAIQLQGADAIITGDGEDAFLEIIQKYDAGESMEGIEGVWWKTAMVKSNATQSVAHQKTSRLTHGQTADAHNINPIICQAPSSQWSPQPLPQGAVLILAHSA